MLENREGYCQDIMMQSVHLRFAYGDSTLQFCDLQRTRRSTTEMLTCPPQLLPCRNRVSWIRRAALHDQEGVPQGSGALPLVLTAPRLRQQGHSEPRVCLVRLFARLLRDSR